LLQELRLVTRVTSGYNCFKELHLVTIGCRYLHFVTDGYIWLRFVTSGYRSYRRLHLVTDVTSGYDCYILLLFSYRIDGWRMDLGVRSSIDWIRFRPVEDGWKRTTDGWIEEDGGSWKDGGRPPFQHRLDRLPASRRRFQSSMDWTRRGRLAGVIRRGL
jgi:hypothetical protein